MLCQPERSGRWEGNVLLSQTYSRISEGDESSHLSNCSTHKESLVRGCLRNHSITIFAKVRSGIFDMLLNALVSSILLFLFARPTSGLAVARNQTDIEIEYSNIRPRHWHFNIEMWRWPDAHCATQQIGDATKQEIVGDGRCFNWGDHIPFRAVSFRWSQHLPCCEHVEQYGNCKISLFADEYCADFEGAILNVSAASYPHMCSGLSGSRRPTMGYGAIVKVLCLGRSSLSALLANSILPLWG
jgi:hypothetical protein